LIRGIFSELFSQIGGITFDPRNVRTVLRAKVEAEPGISLLLGTEVVDPVVTAAGVAGATVRLPDGAHTPITAAVTIDATDDGDLAAAAGVPFTFGRQASGIDRRAMPGH
jgi:hypothetical protein